MTQLHRVCGILDMDGFEIRRVFYAREAGFAPMVDESTCMSETFKIPASVYHQTTDDEKRTIWFVSNRITGLDFFPNRNERPLPQDALERIVFRWYDNFKSSFRDYVGYKGGHFEKDLLKKLSIPSVNIEEFECPRFAVLVESFPSDERCRAHAAKDDKFHCPRTETDVFRKWARSLLYTQF